MNRRNTSSKSNQRQGEDYSKRETKMAQAQQAKLLGQISTSSRIISGVNDVLANPVAADYVYGVTHYALNVSQIPDAASLLVDGALEDVINAFSSSKGYASSVTAGIIRGHLEQVVKAVSALLILKRGQDSKELTDYKGTDISELFNSVATGGRQWITGSGGVDGAKIRTFGIATTELATAGISNAAWGTTYLSELSKLVIPRKLFDLLVSLYSGVYRNTSAGLLDSYIAFWTHDIVGLSGLTTPEVIFANAITAIDSNLNTYPDLRSMLGVLGIDASPCMDYDWNRDVKGQSLVVFEDPLLNTLLNNEFSAYAAFDEFDVPQPFQDAVVLPFVRGTISGIEDSFAVTQDMVPYLGMFRDLGVNDGFSLLQTNMSRTDGVIAAIPALPTGIVSIDTGVTLNVNGFAGIAALTSSFAFGDVVLAKHQPFEIVYFCDTNDCGTFTVSVVPNQAFSGQNHMLFVEADHTITNTMFYTELLFGEDYRANLNNIARSITANIHIG